MNKINLQKTRTVPYNQERKNIFKVRAKFNLMKIPLFCVNSVKFLCPLVYAFFNNKLS